LENARKEIRLNKANQVKADEKAAAAQRAAQIAMDGGAQLQGGTLVCSGGGWEAVPPELALGYGSSVTRLDLSFNNLTSLFGVRDFTLLEELIVDNNQLDHDLNLEGLPHLTTLSINNNNIDNLHSFVRKANQHCPKLTFLSLLKNTACPHFSSELDSSGEYELYRHYMVFAFKQLKFLDSVPITQIERAAAVRRFRNADLAPIRPTKEIFQGIFKNNNKERPHPALEESIDAEAVDDNGEETKALTPNMKRIGTVLCRPFLKDLRLYTERSNLPPACCRCKASTITWTCFSVGGPLSYQPLPSSLSCRHTNTEGISFRAMLGLSPSKNDASDASNAADPDAAADGSSAPTAAAGMIAASTTSKKKASKRSSKKGEAKDMASKEVSPTSFKHGKRPSKLFSTAVPKAPRVSPKVKDKLLAAAQATKEQQESPMKELVWCSALDGIVLRVRGLTMHSAALSDVTCRVCCA
jgi:hypothetical protein